MPEVAAESTQRLSVSTPECVADTDLETHGIYARRMDRIGSILTICAVVAGVGLRAREYFANRSLWLDEAMVSLDIVQRGLGGLLKPLDRAQAAPVMWLWAERASVNAFGNNEWALRAPPFVASLVALVAFVVLARRFLHPFAAGLAVLAFACTPMLIRYSVEVKQYGTDVAVVLLIVLTATRFLDLRNASSAFVWAATCAVGIWFSQ